MRLEELRTGDGRALPPHLKAQIVRELDRLELLLDHIAVVERERDVLVSAADESNPAATPAATLCAIKGVGAEMRPFFAPRGYRVILTIAGRLPPTRDWRPRLGRADRLIARRVESRIPDCERQ